MPKLRKGEIPTSKKHIYRLAKQQTALELANIKAQFISPHEISTSTSHTDDDFQHSDIGVEDINLSAGPHGPHINNYVLHDDKNLKDVMAEKVNDTFIISEDLNSEEVDQSNIYYEDDDAASVASSSVYRYSDSDAESIPDIDSNYHSDDDAPNNEHDSDSDFFDYLLKNPQSAQDENFRIEIEDWAKDNKVPHKTINSLLKILNKYTGTQFPKDSRTLLKTPKSTNVVDMGSGQYCHFGLTNVVIKVIESRLLSEHYFDSVNLLINIDGAPLSHNSSEKGIWTILCKDVDLSNVYPIGIYHGTSKPADPNQFLRNLVDEAKLLINNGFTLNCKIYNVRIHGFIFDSPAKSYILCTKYPTGYFSCSKCTIEGKYYNCVCFPLPDIGHFNIYCDLRLRTDDDFKNLKYTEDYQRGSTVLNELPFVGLVSNVPLDGMHLVYLGVTRQLIRHWIGDKGRKNKTYKLSTIQIDKISDRLEKMKYILPSDFNRRSRSLSYWKLWKATEFRHFLLYFGPLVLKDVVTSKIYNNFLLLHVSISILSSASLVQDTNNIKYAESLLIMFVQGFQKLYGKGNVTFNVHNLLHLAKDVEKYGCLESFSAFPFENYICSLKKLLRKSDKPLQQIARRLTEYECTNVKNTICIKKNEIYVKKYHLSGIITDDRKYQCQYKIININSWCINIEDDRNNCVLLTDGTIVNILNFAKSHNVLYLIGKKCTRKRDLYDFPGFSSSKLGICIISFESNVIEVWPCYMIRAKIFKIPHKNGFLACPQIHTFL